MKYQVNCDHNGFSIFVQITLERTITLFKGFSSMRRSEEDNRQISKKHELFDVSAKLTCFVFHFSSLRLWFTYLAIKQEPSLKLCTSIFSFLLFGSLNYHDILFGHLTMSTTKLYLIS